MRNDDYNTHSIWKRSLFMVGAGANPKIMDTQNLPPQNSHTTEIFYFVPPSRRLVLKFAPLTFCALKLLPAPYLHFPPSVNNDRSLYNMKFENNLCKCDSCNLVNYAI